MHAIDRTSRTSTGMRPYQINDVIEAELIPLERHFNEAGKKPGVALLSGIWRILFGGVEAFVAIIYVLTKLFIAAVTWGCLGRHAAVLPALEALFGCTLVAHGVANVVRGFFEMLHVGTRYDLGHPFKYCTEGRNTLLKDAIPELELWPWENSAEAPLIEELTPRGGMKPLPSIRDFPAVTWENVAFGPPQTPTPRTQEALDRRERFRADVLAAQAIAENMDLRADDRLARFAAAFGSGYQSEAASEDGYAST